MERHLGALERAGANGKQAGQSNMIALRAGQMIDGTRDFIVRDAFILVEGDRIRAVGAAQDISPGTRVIDLSEYAVLPGLIDAHTHVCFAPQDGKDPVLTKSIAYRALQAAAAVRASLNAGFTTLRE